MAKLRFYEDEAELLGDYYDLWLSEEGVRIVYNKLIRHFKVNHPPKLIVANKDVKPHYRIKKDNPINNRFFIKIPKRFCSFNNLCHELAHHIEYTTYGKTAHRKRLLKIINRLMRYCAKKRFWKTELKRRNAQAMLNEYE